MKTYKQIMYRQLDGALIIVPSEESEPTEIRFVSELTEVQMQAFLELKTFLLTQVEEFDYCSYTTNNDELGIQPITGLTVVLIVSELDENDKLTVDKVLAICLELLNN